MQHNAPHCTTHTHANRIFAGGNISRCMLSLHFLLRKEACFRNSSRLWMTLVLQTCHCIPPLVHIFMPTVMWFGDVHFILLIKPWFRVRELQVYNNGVLHCVIFILFCTHARHCNLTQHACGIRQTTCFNTLNTLQHTAMLCDALAQIVADCNVKQHPASVHSNYGFNVFLNTV